MMRRIVFGICGIVFVALVAPGCFGQTASAPPAGGAQSTQFAASTQPAKPLVQFHYLNAIIVCDWTITINADGRLLSVDDPSYGPDRDTESKTEMREGRLTPHQSEKLTKVLKAAVAKPKPTPCVTLDAAVLLEFDGQTYQALGDSRFDEARKMIVELAELFPARVVDPPKHE